jgi:ParB family chromosome partitioning protein
MTTATAERPTTETTTERFERAPIAQFFESPLNPRKTFDPTELRDLAASIQEKDVIEPLVARLSNTRLEIICGARRYRAAKLANKADLPVVIREYTDAQAIEIMAIENGQRASVPPLEEAEGYRGCCSSRRRTRRR